MPVKKQEAHRALELLEDYHSRLSSPQDHALRSAIERVIRIFKSRLFQALLDIQEFYELTLLDETKTVQQKTIETLLIASKWEHDNAVKASETNRIKQQEYQLQPEEQHHQQQHLRQKQILQEENKPPIIDLPESKLTTPKCTFPNGSQPRASMREAIFASEVSSRRAILTKLLEGSIPCFIRSDQRWQMLALSVFLRLRGLENFARVSQCQVREMFPLLPKHFAKLYYYLLLTDPLNGLEKQLRRLFGLRPTTSWTISNRISRKLASFERLARRSHS